MAYVPKLQLCQRINVGRWSSDDDETEAMILVMQKPLKTSRSARTISTHLLVRRLAQQSQMRLSVNLSITTYTYLLRALYQALPIDNTYDDHLRIR